jgi:hypothetical protein
MVDPEGNDVTYDKFDPNTGAPVDSSGSPLPIDENGQVTNPETNEPFPQTYQPKLGRKTDPESGEMDSTPYDPFTGLPKDIVTDTPYAVHQDTGAPVNPRTGYTAPGVHNPKNGKPMTENGATIPDRFDAETGQPINPKTSAPFPIDEETGHPYDPETKKKLPGTYDPITGKPVDEKTKRPVKEPELPTDDDKKKWVPTRVLNDPLFEEYGKDPEAFLSGGRPGENTGNQPDYSNPNQNPSEEITKNPGKLPKNPA